jgi:hypothetical protein
VPYLANAYRFADGDEDRAVTLFSSGYYYTADQKKMLATLQSIRGIPKDARKRAMDETW